MRPKNLTRSTALAMLAPWALAAAEYHGLVTFGGLPVPGVTVTATRGAQTVTTASDQLGVYSFADLPDGNWSLELDKPGFSAVKQDATVSGRLPGPSIALTMLPLNQMQTTTPVLTTTVTPSAPISDRVTAAKPAAVFGRIDLKAGVSAADPEAVGPEPEVTTELSQRAADGFLINGSAVNGASTPFAQARAFGNARRGGPRLYTYALSLADSNSALNAANYSLTGQNTPKPPFNNMTGTVSFGGPLRIPRFLPRNGPLMTVNYSRLENHSSLVYTGLMPDAAERAGDLSQLLRSRRPVTIDDPENGQPFAGNMIPVSRISPQALSLLQYYPEPNFAKGTGYNYQVPLIGNTHTDNLRTSLQESFKRRNTISGLFAVSDTRSDNNSQFNFLDLTRSLGINSSATYRRAYTPRFFGTLMFQFSRNSTERFPFFANRENVSAGAGITGNNQTPLYWGPPSLQFNQSGISGLSDGAASTVHYQTVAISYSSSWNHREHNVTFGGDERWQQFNTISQSNPRGTFTFSGAATGYDFADFLLGTPDASAIAFGNADKYLRATQSDLFWQDDWRARSGLTLTLGLRWEYTSPITEKYGRLVNLDVGPGFAAIAPVVANSANSLTGPLTGLKYPGSLIRPDYHEMEPRLGLAWRPFAASSMVLRAGYGISYNTQVYLPFANLMVQQSPLSTSLNVVNTATNPLNLANGFYAPPNVTTNTAAVNRNFKIGKAQVWNMSVQRDLPGALQIVATYVGTKGTHQLQAFAPNTYPTGATNPSGYTYYTSNANSTRQAVMSQLRRRLHNGLQAELRYTYSKSIDDAASLGGGTLGSVAQNWLNLRGERGLSSFDQRHLANITVQYTSGFSVGGGTLLDGWRGRLMKDWTFVDAVNVGTGLPLNPIYTQLIPGTGIPGIVRPNYTGASLYRAPVGYFLNPAAVGAPASGSWGNAGRNSITGPGQFSMNASMSRAFRLTDRFTLNLRLDASNPLNHVVFTNWNTTITSSQFGLPGAVNGMRTVTTTLRLTF